MDFGHYTDGSVDLAIDLINTFATVPRAAAHDPAHGDDHDHAVGDLGAFMRAHGLDDAGVTAAHDDDAVALADRLHAAATAQSAAEATSALNAVLRDAGAMPQISGHDGHDLHLHYHPIEAGPLERVAAIAAMGLATVLCTGGLRRLGQCDGIACRDVFVDSSRNNRRRFCGDGCANRVHVTAHRARRRDADG